jgi:hypothetical protein
MPAAIPQMSGQEKEVPLFVVIPLLANTLGKTTDSP